MNFNQYISAVKEQLNQMSDSQKASWIYGQARKIEERDRQEFLACLSGKESVGRRLSAEEIFQWCRKVEEGEVYFSAEIYEEFEEGAWESELKGRYHDIFDLMPYLEHVKDICCLWMENEEYEIAYQILDRICQLEFRIECEENDYMLKEDPSYPNNLISLENLKREKLLSINLDELSLMLLYSCYQSVTGRKRLEAMHEYLVWGIGQKLVMTDAFAFGEDLRESPHAFMTAWRSFLMEISGDRSAELLVDACVFLGGEQQLLETARDNGSFHPYLYQAYCERKYLSGQYQNCVEAAREAIEHLDENKMIRGAIADIGAKAAKRLEDENAYARFCLDAFWSEPSSWHLLRLFTLSNSSVIEKAKERLERISTDLPEKRADSVEQKTTFLYEREQKMIYQFLLGDYGPVLQYCKDEENYLGWSYGLKGMVIPLLLLYFKEDSAEGTKTRAENGIREQLEYRLRFECGEGVEFDPYLAAWKKAYKVPEEMRTQWLEWLTEEVEQRTEAIVGGVRIKSYYKAAQLIVMLGEIREEQGEAGGQKELIQYYLDKYSQRWALKKEISKMARRW